VNPSFSAATSVAFFDAKTRLMVHGQEYDTVRNVTLLSGRKYAIELETGKVFLDDVPVKVGDFITCHPRLKQQFSSLVSHFLFRFGFTVYLDNTENMQLNDINIYGSSNFAIHEVGGEGGNVYSNVKLVRREGSDRLIASNADGFHSTSLRQGPTIQNCELSFAGDDFVNVHTIISMIFKRVSDNELVVIDPSHPSRVFSHVGVGDALAFYRLNLMTFVGEYHVAEVASIENTTMIEEAKQTPHVLSKNGTIIRLMDSLTLWKVKFKEMLPESVKIYDLIHFDGYSSPNALITKSYFHDGKN